MKDMILFPEDIERLNVVLVQLTRKANLLLSVLINKDGRLLTYQGSLDQIDTVSMAALVAGNSASTLAIANLMGETEFSAMYHQGKDRHIYIAVVDENTFLCLVFDERTNIDRVKVFARQFDRQIKKALMQVYDKTEDQVDLDLDMAGEVEPLFEQQQNPSQNHTFTPDQQESYQQPSALLKPEPVNEPFPQVPSDGYASSQNGTVPPPSSGDGRQVPDNVFYTEHSGKSQKQSESGHDTNYLYLKKKIRETVKRKKDT